MTGFLDLVRAELLDAMIFSIPVAWDGQGVDTLGPNGLLGAK